MNAEIGDMVEDNIIRFGTHYRGKSMEDIDIVRLDAYLATLEDIENPHPVIIAGMEQIKRYLQRPEKAALLETELDRLG